MLLLKEKWCKGCKYYNVQYYIGCDISPIIKGKKCPCITCLVKTMCTEICFEWFSFRDSKDIL